MGSLFPIIMSILAATMIAESATQPNIFIIMVDDMGFGDASLQGSNQIPTPNMDAFSVFGIGLPRYYTAPMCTPTRSSLLTGKYPSSVGMQDYVIENFEPWGLGLDQKLLSELMQDSGYATHLVGKWHTGFYKSSITPNNRGYKSFFGFYGGYIDYFNYTCDSLVPGLTKGYDMRDNFEVPLDRVGNYTSNMFTDVALQKIQEHDPSLPLFMHISYNAPHSANPSDPLQAPAEWVTKMGHIEDENRRLYAAMVGSADYNIGRLVSGIDAAGLLDNSVIVFVSDNGAPVQGQLNNYGSNYPFRGQKNSPWDGAARVTAAIWSPLLQNKERVTNQLIHVSDWLPTLGHVAGFKADGPIDGVDQWLSLSTGAADPRTDVLVNTEGDYTSYVNGQYKYVRGTTSNGQYDGWLSNSYNRSESPANFDYAAAVLASDTAQSLKRFSKLATSPELTQQVLNTRQNAAVTCNGVTQNLLQQCLPLVSACLFDIVNDPCEYNNLAAKLPDQLAAIRKTANSYKSIAVAERNQPIDIRSNPKNYNNTWTYWYDVVGTPSVGVSLLNSILALLVGD